jgi:hypothetical protein
MARLKEVNGLSSTARVDDIIMLLYVDLIDVNISVLLSATLSIPFSLKMLLIKYAFYWNHQFGEHNHSWCNTRLLILRLFMQIGVWNSTDGQLTVELVDTNHTDKMHKPNVTYIVTTILVSELDC